MAFVGGKEAATYASSILRIGSSTPHGRQRLQEAEQGHVSGCLLRVGGDMHRSCRPLLMHLILHRPGFTRIKM